MTIATSPKISIEQVAELSARVVQEVEKAVVGKREVLNLMMAAFLSIRRSYPAGGLPGPGQDPDRQLFC